MKVFNWIKKNGWLTAILVLGGILRFYHIDYQSIWLDEIHTMIEANTDISYKESYEILIFREQMPHLYFLCVKLFSTVFGHTTFVVRMFSALTGILSILFIYLLGKEIKNQKTGLIAALLLSLNHFHIWYSQEARPYALLALMTILSFYRLVIFVKNSNIKTALLYGFFTALMINTHFFGLFILVSQSIILLYFVFDLPSYERIRFLKLSIISGVITIFLWLPSLTIFLSVMKIKSFWIQPPTLEVYTQLFKEFFGNSEVLLMIVFFITVFYFIRLFEQKRDSETSIKQNGILFSFVILAIWISITLFIPLVRSYLDVPMIISRYFIGVLPAVILIVSIGISSVRSSSVTKSILLFVVIASLTDIIVIKNHYNKTNKTQFREITEIILKRNKNREKVVSSYGWLMSYFLNKNSTNNPLLASSTKNDIAVDSSLEDYIILMKNKTIPMESFWYLDGNSMPYQLTPEQEMFLNENFTVESSIGKFDTWTKHYVSKTIQNIDSQKTDFDIKNFKPGNLDKEGNMFLFENSTIKSPGFFIEKGSYELTISGNSLPDKPIDGVNAHLIIKVGDREIGDYYLSEKITEKQKIINFENKQNQHCIISLTFDNDLSKDNLDRNVIIHNIKLIKK